MSHDSTFLPIETISTLGGNCRPMLWKRCGSCVMQSWKVTGYKACRRKFQAVAWNCVLYCVDIKNVLRPAIVCLAWRMQKKASGFLDADACKLSIMTNKSDRHHAYREYIEYRHGLLGNITVRLFPTVSCGTFGVGGQTQMITCWARLPNRALQPWLKQMSSFLKVNQ